MGSTPLVSVVIPAFNAQDSIGETLDSILAQTYKNLEIIVVDDGSTDQTAAIVRSYKPRVLYHYRSNSGGSAVPRNDGIARSAGELLCFFDADDILVSDRIAHQVEFMGRYPQVGLVFCDYRNFNEKGPDLNSHFQNCPLLWSRLRGRRELIVENPCELLVQENFGIAGSFLMRRDILKFAAGFEPTLRACEDFHFYFRLARHSQVGVINEVGMMRRLHASNMSGSLLRMESEGVRSRALLRDSEHDPGIREHLDRSIAESHGYLARYHADHGDYLRAFREQGRALYCNASASQFWVFCRGIARTIAIATGTRRPGVDES